MSKTIPFKLSKTSNLMNLMNKILLHITDNEIRIKNNNNEIIINENGMNINNILHIKEQTITNVDSTNGLIELKEDKIEYPSNPIYLASNDENMAYEALKEMKQEDKKSEIDLRGTKTPSGGIVEWISQYDTSVPNHGDAACFNACKLILTNSGLSDKSASSLLIIYVAEENSDSDSTDQKSYLSIKATAKDAIVYLDSELESGYPVLAGVDHTHGKGYNEGTTDHFVVIVGRGYDNEKLFYRFYEVGTGKYAFYDKSNNLLKTPNIELLNNTYRLYGVSDDNKLYLQNNEYFIQGKTAYKKDRNYAITQIRRNVK